MDGLEDFLKPGDQFPIYASLGGNPHVLQLMLRK